MPIYGGMGVDGAGLWGAYVRSTAALVTTSVGERLGNFFWTGKISIVWDNPSDDVLGMYDVRHI